MTRYSLDLRHRVVHAYKQHGATFRNVAKTFQISTRTVLRWVKQEKEKGHLEPQPYRGGPKSQRIGKEGQLEEMVKANPDYTLAEYCEVWREKTGQDIHYTTMSRWLISQGYTRKKNSAEQSGTDRRQTETAFRVLAKSERDTVREFSLPR